LQRRRVEPSGGRVRIGNRRLRARPRPRRHQRAQRRDTRRRSHRRTTSERNEYESANATRQQAMAGTAVTLAVGGALAITTLALYFFERR
jgi:hypothetical protein